MGQMDGSKDGSDREIGYVMRMLWSEIQNQKRQRLHRWKVTPVQVGARTGSA